MSENKKIGEHDKNRWHYDRVFLNYLNSKEYIYGKTKVITTEEEKSSSFFYFLPRC